MRLLVVALAFLAGCKTQISSGFGVALTMVADSSITDAALKTVTQLDLTVSGDENELAHHDFTRAVQRRESVVYRPRTSSRRITIVVTVRDAGGIAVGSGSTVELSLLPGSLASATVTLSAGGSPPVDMAGVDFASGGDLADLDLAGPDLAGADLACAQPEDCFNGVDDDCDGLADCADPSCDPAAECVPTATAMGTMVDSTSACPSQFEAFSVPLNQGIQQGTSCNGCSCTPTTVCHTNIFDYAAATCPGATSGQMFQSENTYCQSNGSLGINYDSKKIKIDPITLNSTSCAGTGTPSPPPLAWDRRGRFCQTNSMGAGCTVGNVCVPKIVKHCALLTGNVACPSGYTPEGAGPGTPWHSGSTEGRSCTACSTCGSPSGGSCAGALVGFYVMKDCVGSPILLAGNMSHCALGDNYDSARIVGGTPPTCGGASGSSVTGSATETGPHTVCCR